MTLATDLDPTARTPRRGRRSRLEEPTRSVYLRRFCANDEASTSAAIRQAVASLDSFFAQRGKLPDKLIIIYRNMQPQTVTLDIAMPATHMAPIPEGSELRCGSLPSTGGPAVAAEAGFGGLLSASNQLRAMAASHMDLSSLVFWQSFDADQYRPWRGHPRALLHLAT